MGLPESSTASCEAFSVAPCLRENTKKERTNGCSGAAEPGVFGWKVNSRRPLNRGDGRRPKRVLVKVMGD